MAPAEAPPAPAPAPAAPEAPQDALSAALGRLKQVEMHGFVTQGYLKTTKNNFLGETARDQGTFDYSQIGLAFSTDVTDQLRIGLQLNARRMGVVGGSGVGLDWGFGDWAWRPWLGVRAGVLRVPLGLFNETRDVDPARHMAILPESIYAESWRDTMASLMGVGLYGSLGPVSYQLVGGTQTVSTTGATSLALERSGLVADLSAFDVDYAVAFSLFWDTPVSGLRLGLSAMDDPATVRGTKTVFWDYVADYTSEQWGLHPVPHVADGSPVTLRLDYNATAILSVEYQRGGFTLLVEGDVVALGYDFVETGKAAPNLTAGGYVAGQYRFNDWLELGLRFEAAVDVLDPGGADYWQIHRPSFAAWQYNYALSLRLDPLPFLAVKLEGQFVDGVCMLQPESTPGGLSRYWGLFVAKASFFF